METVCIEKKKGIVEGCELLNLRSEPNGSSDVVAILPKGSILLIDPNFENEYFYRVIVEKMLNRNKYSFTRDYHGYCMKKFIKI